MLKMSIFLSRSGVFRRIFDRSEAVSSSSIFDGTRLLFRCFTTSPSSSKSWTRSRTSSEIFWTIQKSSDLDSFGGVRSLFHNNKILLLFLRMNDWCILRLPGHVVSFLAFVILVRFLSTITYHGVRKKIKRAMSLCLQLFWAPSSASFGIWCLTH